MSKLKELEKRLKSEPDNLGLRVMVAGALIEAGRHADAAELYHSVAIAYRDQGRPQQAIAVCRSLLELAPGDLACQALLTALTAPPEDAVAAPRLPQPQPPQLPPPEDAAEAEGPPRRSSIDVTPLPAPLPYHVADPSSLSRPKLSRADLPPSLRQEHAMIPEIEGIANAAREISASLLAASPPDPADADLVGSREETLDVDGVVELTDAEDGFDSRRRAPSDPHAALEHLATLRPTVRPGRPIGASDDGDTGDDELTLPPKLDAIPHPRGVDDEKTRPRERPPGMSSAPVEATARSRSSHSSRPLTSELRSLADRPGPRGDQADPVTEPRNLAGVARSNRTSRPLVSESRSLPDRAALSVDPPDPVTEPRVRRPARPAESPAVSGPADRRPPPVAAAGSREIPRQKPPSIAPATQATGPLASALFAPVPPRDRAIVLQRFRRRLAGVGTTVIRRGEAGHGLILVVRGRLDVHAEGADGARVSLDAIGPGDYVGEIGLVSRTASAAYVVAAIDSELLVLAASDFYELAGEFSALWAAVREVAERRTRDHAVRLQA